MKPPAPADTVYELVPGVFAYAPGVVWLEQSRTLVAADAHLAYEDVIGGALPTWSTRETATTLLVLATRLHARELVLLGDIIHGNRMSEGAARAVERAIASLRGYCEVTLVAGNHEGRTRGAAVLGETVEEAQREGWLLVHGDRAPRAGARAIIGHLHPSLRLGGGEAAPAFLASERVIVVPALTPYSGGLDVCSESCRLALRPYAVDRADLHVVAVAGERVYPFGRLDELRDALRGPQPLKRRIRAHRKQVHPD